MPLSDVTIRKAKPADKTQRLFDGGGLYLEIAPTGGKPVNGHRAAAGGR